MSCFACAVAVMEISAEEVFELGKIYGDGESAEKWLDAGSFILHRLPAAYSKLSEMNAQLFPQSRQMLCAF